MSFVITVCKRFSFVPNTREIYVPLAMKGGTKEGNIPPFKLTG